MAKVAGIESVPPVGLQYNDIISYYQKMKITNGTGLDCLIFYFNIISQKIYRMLVDAILIQLPQWF